MRVPDRTGLFQTSVNMFGGPGACSPRKPNFFGVLPELGCQGKASGYHKINAPNFKDCIATIACDSQKAGSPWIDQFRYIKIYSWHRGLGEENKRNLLFIAESQDDVFCFIPPGLAAKCEF